MIDLTPLRAKIDQLHIDPPTGFFDRAESYTARLIEKNRVMNLTAVPDGEIILRHFCDSVEAAALVDFPGKSVIDIGCGAGFPGIPLKFLFPDIALTLLDSTAKKLAFIAEATADMGLQNLTLLPARAEEAAHEPSLRESFDISLSRATAYMPILCELCLPFVKKGGLFVAYKTEKSADELELGRNAARTLGGEYRMLHDYQLVPGMVNRLVVVRKLSQTSGRYPRKYSQIKQKPL